MAELSKGQVEEPDGLSESIAAAVRAYKSMSPVDRALHDADQRRSFVRRQSGRDPGPDVLAEEVRRQRAEIARITRDRDACAQEREAARQEAKEARAEIEGLRAENEQLVETVAHTKRHWEEAFNAERTEAEGLRARVAELEERLLATNSTSAPAP